MSKEEVEKIALEDAQTAKYLEGQTIKKIIVVPDKIVNIVM
jgi:leucyl-tRNA synthetase